jgi:hypothetical protein
MTHVAYIFYKNKRATRSPSLGGKCGAPSYRWWFFLMWFNSSRWDLSNDTCDIVIETLICFKGIFSFFPLSQPLQFFFIYKN